MPDTLAPVYWTADMVRRLPEDGWIVDGNVWQVEVWTPGDAFPRIEHDSLGWQPEGAGAPFTPALRELFRAIE